MSAYLRVLGVVLLVAGVTGCVVATRWTLADDTYYRAAQALERHSDHIIFQAEYQASLARHVAYVAGAVLSGLGGVVGSAVLFGLAAILRRVDRARGESPVASGA